MVYCYSFYNSSYRNLINYCNFSHLKIYVYKIMLSYLQHLYIYIYIFFKAFIININCQFVYINHPKYLHNNFFCLKLLISVYTTNKALKSTFTTIFLVIVQCVPIWIHTSCSTTGRRQSTTFLLLVHWNLAVLHFDLHTWVMSST